jgi:RimJ/RimL family protein N-acetyltransferase
MMTENEKDLILDILIFLEKNFATTRLSLRSLLLSDKNEFLEIFSDATSNYNMGYPSSSNKEIFENHFYSVINKTSKFELTLGIVLKETNKVIGEISFGTRPFFYTDKKLIDMLGVSLSFALNPKYQHQGLMSELLPPLIDIVFDNFPIDFINAGYFSFNTASEKLQKKVGFQYYLTRDFSRGDIKTKLIESMIFRKK